MSSTQPPDAAGAIQAAYDSLVNATPGPLSAEYETGPLGPMATLYAGRTDDRHGFNLLGRLNPDSDTRNTLAFIVAAHTHLPALLAELARLREERDAAAAKYERDATEWAKELDTIRTVRDAAIRVAMEANARIATLTVENAALRGVVAKLPVTRDGVPVLPGMKVWFSPDPDEYMDIDRVAIGDGFAEAWCDGDSVFDSSDDPPTAIWSSAAAALSAQQAAGQGGTP
jgi:hypothetical protein